MALSKKKLLLRGFFGFLIAAPLAGVIGLVVAFFRTPIPPINPFIDTQASVVTFSNGTEVGRFAAENRIEVKLSNIPIHVRKAVLAAEDAEFFDQPAFSIRGILRATVNNLQGGELQGGSTITQQYAKLAYLTSERTISRKLRELFVAIRLEQKYSKNELLERYLNAVFFGRGAYGVETAANQYFDKSVSALSLAEGIVLASIIRSPGLYDPQGSPENKLRLIKRFASIASEMHARNWISDSVKDGLRFPEIIERKKIQAFEGNKGHLLEAVRLELIQLGFSEEEIEKSGLRIKTTLDRNYQIAAENAVSNGRPKGAPKDLHIGLAAVEPGTGRVLALYGGPDYLQRQLNNSTQAIAQAGSTFKIFGLAAALERGISLATIWDGKSPQYYYGAGKPYRVSNSGNAQYGKVSLLRATASSVNTVFVRVAYRTGFAPIVDVARRAGIPQEVEMLPTPSFVLGVSSPRVIDVASAFSTFASGGVRHKTHIVESVLSKAGKVLHSENKEGERVFTKEVAADVNYALRSVVQSGTASGALWDLGRPAAGKTGTSQNNASAWFTGYTPQMSASVALFRDDATESLNGIGGLNSVTGGSFPARIWKSFVKEALVRVPAKSFAPPSFIGGTRAVDLINPSPTEKPSKKKDKEKKGEDKTGTENPAGGKVKVDPNKPKLPKVTTKPIPLPSVSTIKLP